MTHLPTIFRGIPVALQPKIVSQNYPFSGWWFQICLTCSPQTLWKMNPFWLPIFFKGKTTQLPFWIFAKRTKKPSGRCILATWKKSHLGTSAAIENRGGAHPSTFYLPALVSDFYFPPDEWIPLVRSVCVFCDDVWNCIFVEEFVWKVIMKDVCVCVSLWCVDCGIVFLEKRLCVTSQVGPLLNTKRMVASSIQNKYHLTSIYITFKYMLDFLTNKHIYWKRPDHHRNFRYFNFAKVSILQKFLYLIDASSPFTMDLCRIFAGCFTAAKPPCGSPMVWDKIGRVKGWTIHVWSFLGGKAAVVCHKHHLSNEKNPGCLGYIGDYVGL